MTLSRGYRKAIVPWAPWEMQFVMLSHLIPSHETFPKGFPWESHSRGQACLLRLHYYASATFFCCLELKLAYCIFWATL